MVCCHAKRVMLSFVLSTKRIPSCNSCYMHPWEIYPLIRDVQRPRRKTEPLKEKPISSEIKMLQIIKQAVLFQCILHVQIYGGHFRSYYVVKSNVYADESCIKIEKTESTLICFAKCMNFPNSHSLFCYNGNLQSCMCCNVSVANGVQSFGWEAYTIRAVSYTHLTLPTICSV